jgi:carboxypeptidase Q
LLVVFSAFSASPREILTAAEPEPSISSGMPRLLPAAALTALVSLPLAAQTPNAPARGTPSHVGTAEVPNALPAVTPGPSVAAYQATVDRIIAEAQKDSAAWKRMAELTDTFGPRLSGTPALEAALDWVLATMKKDGLQNVRGEPVMVPHWDRGAESAVMVTPTRRKSLTILGLGGTVGTPAAGVTAPVVVMSSFDELERRAAEVKGKIVLFDVPFTSYGETVAYRGAGPSRVAKLGAVGMLLRSVASYSMNTPHTGGLRYDTTVAKIPAAAVAVEDAELMHRAIDRGQPVAVTLKLGGRFLPDAPSKNAIGELVGREKPDEIVIVSGHMDSWDVGQGAMDDAGGVVVSWEAVTLLKRLGLTPRRTIRVIGWTNEENGGRGGQGYAKAHAAEAAKHVFAMESDNGAFRPLGMGVTAPDSAVAVLRQVGALLGGLQATAVTLGGGGADTGPLQRLGVPVGEPEVDGSKYFWFHHTNADMPDKLDPAEMAKLVGLVAAYAYVIADLPEALPHGAPRATAQ